MSVLIFLIPLTLILSLGGLFAFMWCVKNKQYDDLDGASNRILFDDKIENNNSNNQPSNQRAKSSISKA